jgi:hypothetical protein
MHAVLRLPTKYFFLLRDEAVWCATGTGFLAVEVRWKILCAVLPYPAPVESIADMNTLDCEASQGDSLSSFKVINYGRSSSSVEEGGELVAVLDLLVTSRSHGISTQS